MLQMSSFATSACPRLVAHASGVAHVSEVSGAHHLFVSNPREVLEQIEGFVAAFAR